MRWNVLKLRSLFCSELNYWVETKFFKLNEFIHKYIKYVQSYKIFSKLVSWKVFETEGFFHMVFHKVFSHCLVFHIILWTWTTSCVNNFWNFTIGWSEFGAEVHFFVWKHCILRELYSPCVIAHINSLCGWVRLLNPKYFFRKWDVQIVLSRLTIWYSSFLL